MIELIDNLSIKDLQQIAIVAGGLNSFSASGSNDIVDLIQKFGMVQLDPINPAGRNHDIFLLSRLNDYKLGKFEKILYGKKKQVFEAYFPNLMAIDILLYPELKHLFLEENLHPYYQERLIKFNKKYPRVLNKIIRYIKDNGETNSNNLIELGKASKETMVWKSNRVSGTGLELLWLLGKIMVVKRDKQFKKSYDLIERHIPKGYLEQANLYKNNEEMKINLFMLKQKYRHLISVGNITYDNASSLKIGKTKIVNTTILEQTSKEKFFLAKIPNSKRGLFLPQDWEKHLKKDYDDSIRALCPLDPLIHDRDITSLLFKFDYVWEIYKKPEQRKWGYYVYPLLYKNRFIGRIEASIKKDDANLKFFNFIPEKKQKIDHQLLIQLKDLFKRWIDMLEIESYTVDDTIKI